jgi:hypothetical protein
VTSCHSSDLDLRRQGLAIPSGLWETVGIMARAQRSLLIVHDPKLLGTCTICGLQFSGTDADIMQKFAGHACSEDASQSGRRIVSEAPEDQ